MISTRGSLQNYGADNHSFESCQLDLETEAMKTSNENLLSWQARLHTDAHTCKYRHRLFTTPPQVHLDKWYFHM